MTLARLPLSVLSPGGPRARLSILIFHRVLAAPDPLFPNEVDTTMFDAMCGWIAALFKVLPLDEAVTRLRADTLPARAACITFDDGYADNCTQAMPILQRHGLSATFYIATGFLDGGRMWNDTVIESIRGTRHAALDLSSLKLEGLGEVALDTVAKQRVAIDAILLRIKHKAFDERLALTLALAQLSGATLRDNLMMSSQQLRQLRAGGMLIGGHTVSHPILATLPVEQARREMLESRQRLEAILGEPIKHFAYPNGQRGGDYNDDHVRLARELGFDSAVCTTWGAARSGSDCHQLPRFSPWDRTPARFALRMMRNLWSS